jgi:hypothetical protein
MPQEARKARKNKLIQQNMLKGKLKPPKNYLQKLNDLKCIFCDVSKLLIVFK